MHKFINIQALDILKNEKRVEAYEFYKKYIKYINGTEITKELPSFLFKTISSNLIKPISIKFRNSNITSWSNDRLPSIIT